MTSTRFCCIMVHHYFSFLISFSEGIKRIVVTHDFPIIGALFVKQYADEDFSQVF